MAIFRFNFYLYDRFVVLFAQKIHVSNFRNVLFCSKICIEA